MLVDNARMVVGQLDLGRGREGAGNDCRSRVCGGRGGRRDVLSLLIFSGGEQLLIASPNTP